MIEWKISEGKRGPSQISAAGGKTPANQQFNTASTPCGTGGAVWRTKEDQEIRGSRTVGCLEGVWVWTTRAVDFERGEQLIRANHARRDTDPGGGLGGKY